MPGHKKHATRSGQRSRRCGIEPMEPRTLLSGGSFGSTGYHSFTSTDSTFSGRQATSSTDRFADNSGFHRERDRYDSTWQSRDTIGDRTSLIQPQAPISQPQSADATDTLEFHVQSVDPASSNSAGSVDSISNSSAPSDLVIVSGPVSVTVIVETGSSTIDLQAPTGRIGIVVGASDQDGIRDNDFRPDYSNFGDTHSSDIFGHFPQINIPLPPLHNDYFHGGGFTQHYNHQPPHDSSGDDSLPRAGDTTVLSRPGQAIALAGNATPAASNVVRLAASNVVKSIFSNEQISTASTTPVSAAASIPTIAAPSEQAARSVMYYLATLTENARPILVTAKAAAVAVAGENVVHVAQTGTEMAMASVVTVLPSPHRAIEIVRMGSPIMLVADSIGAFIEESVQMTLTATAKAPRPTHRAWYVTGAVIAADVIMLAYCYHRRRQEQVVEAVTVRRISR